MSRFALMLFIAFTIISCGEKKDWAKAGYNDGYAVGYNTTCKIRTTMIEGNFKKKQYGENYRRGFYDGAADCRAKTKPRTNNP